MKWLWLAAAVLLAVAAFAVFWAFQRPDFVVGLLVATAAAAFKALTHLPSFAEIKAKHTPEEWRKMREERDRRQRGDK